MMTLTCVPRFSSAPLWLFTLVFVLFSACNPSSHSSEQVERPPEDPFAHISDAQVKTLLQKAMKSMGGLENWRSINELHFRKQFALYTEEGQTELERDQQHDYHFKPELLIEIGWMQDEAKHLIQYDGNSLGKTIGGEPDTHSSKASLEASLFSSTFVVSLPFNMLDPGAELVYQGLDTLDTGQPVEVLQARYNPEAHENHTTPDTWHLHFHPNTYKLLGYTVQHADHFSYVLNLRDTVVNGFSFPLERESYRVDENGKRLYLRADYTYSGYQVIP